MRWDAQTGRQAASGTHKRTHMLLRTCACSARVLGQLCRQPRPATRFSGVGTPLVHAGRLWRGLARAGPVHDGQVLSAGVLSRKLEELSVRTTGMQQARCVSTCPWQRAESRPSRTGC